MTQGSRLIEALTRDELLTIVDMFSLAIPNRRNKAGLIDAVAGLKVSSLKQALEELPRARLKELCRDLEFDDTGRDKAVLVGRLLAGLKANRSSRLATSDVTKAEFSLADSRETETGATSSNESTGTKVRGQALVLLSGGVDSSSCVAFYLRLRFSVDCIFVDYGHPAATAERMSARAIASHYGVRLLETKIKGVPRHGAGFIPGRNALLVCSALACALPSSGLIALGIHGGTNYPDCSPQFVAACQALVDVYNEGRVQVAAPFLNWTKGNIFDYALDAKVPLDQTYSCETGAKAPCGKCLSCQDRARRQ